MSIEYVGDIDINQAGATAILTALSHDSCYALLPSSDPSRIALRITANPERKNWTEDVEIAWGHGLRVVFHSATRDERHGLLELIKQTLAELGQTVQFEED